MSLIGMVVYSTEENKKDECLEKTLASLVQTVDFSNNRLMLSINGFTDETLRVIKDYRSYIEAVIENDSNLGTAEALNHIIRKRRQKEYVVKIDDDIVIHQAGWLDIMQEAMEIDNQIGIVGLKRKDLIQHPKHPDPQFKSELILLPHIPGHRWITIERTADIMGSCTMFNHRLIDKIGYSRQPGKYGFEDNLYCHRSHLAGYYNCFVNCIEIDHIDAGNSPYQAWKEKHSGNMFPEYHALVHRMIKGEESIYYNPYV